MNTHYRLKPLPLLIASTVSAIILFSCAAGRGPYNRGHKAEEARDFEVAMKEYKDALDHEPGNTDYRMKYEQSRFEAGFQHFQNGRRAFDNGDLDTAKAEFQRAMEIDPTNDMAEAELKRVTDIQQQRQRKEPETPHVFEDLKQSMRTNPSVQSQMEPKITGPISFRMTQDSRTVFETLAQLAGFNVIFDDTFRGTRIPIELNNVDIYEALDIVALQTRTFWIPVNKNTILVSPDNQTKRRDYEQHVLKTIYLSNSVTSTEITEAITALRTLLNMRYIAQSTAMNAIIVRDTADRVAIAEKILNDVDKSKPEVVVEAMVLEVDRNTARSLGISPPTSTSLTFTNPQASDKTDNSVTLRGLSNVNSGDFSITIPAATAQALATSNNVKLLQNPRVRATDNKLASIRIGSKVPVPSGSFQPAFVGATGTPVVQYVYQDIGVNLDITPRVLLNREISMTVVVQVSALAGDRDAGGLKLPVFTNRSISHEIRLTEGETNILGGIITDTESVSLSGIPGLRDIPILKYLFSQETKSRDNQEIIIMLTPHIVRMPELTADNLRGISIGTEVNTRLRNAPASAVPPSSSPAAAPAGPPAPQAEAAPAAPNISAPAALPGQPGATAPPAPAPAPRPTNSTVSFSPSPLTLSATQPTPLNILINGTDIFAADLTLSFDPAAVKIQDIRDGGFLSRDGQILAVVQKIDSENGTAHVTLERPPSSAPLSGNGTLVTLMLQPGTHKGQSTVQVTDFRLRDAQQGVQIGKATETTVTVP